jgi:hypothetical protein
MLQMTKGSFTIPLVVAGGFCVLGALSYLVVVGRVEPLRSTRDHPVGEEAYAHHS